MGQFKIKNFIGIASLLSWIGFLAYFETLEEILFLDPANSYYPALLFTLFLTVPVFFIFITLDLWFGAFSLIATCFFLLVDFKFEIYCFSIPALFISAFVGYRIRKAFAREIKTREMRIEKMDEDLNLLKNDIKRQENDNLRMRSSLGRTARLKKIVEQYSQTVSEESVLNSIADNGFDLFEDANRVLLYLSDMEKQELNLARVRKRQVLLVAKAKKGDMFDRWVLKHRMPLLVEDIDSDFRFSKDEYTDRGFSSLIEVSLVSEHKIAGVLRVDSKKKNAFSQLDIRFLSIIGDLSSVSLQNAILYQKVENLATHDSLTGLYVHRFFMEKLKAEIKRSLRNSVGISLLMIDLDNFKTYNDRYGHAAGDMMLKQVSSILRSFAGYGDVVSRYGGEEFAFLLTKHDKAKASDIAESIRKKIAETPLVVRREKTGITVSIGVASCPSDKNTAEDIVEMADSRLYEAKKRGKNRVRKN